MEHGVTSKDPQTAGAAVSIGVPPAGEPTPSSYAFCLLESLFQNEVVLREAEEGEAYHPVCDEGRELVNNLKYFLLKNNFIIT